MSRITISDLAIDSNSFINEVAETEAAFVNGGYDKELISQLLEFNTFLVLEITKVFAKALNDGFLATLKLFLEY